MSVTSGAYISEGINTEDISNNDLFTRNSEAE